MFEQCVERSSRFIRHVESRVVPLHDTKNQIEATKCKADRHSERGGKSCWVDRYDGIL